MDETVVTTTQAAALLGASRQHVADLADRGEIPSWRNGTHRRFRRDDVLAYLSRLRGATDGDDLGAMTLTDRRSLAYGLLLGARLVASPDTVLSRARRNLEQLRSVHSDGSADPNLDRWGALLASPVDQILRILTSVDEEAVALRHTAPFAGVLTEAQRRSVIRDTRRTAA